MRRRQSSLPLIETPDSKRINEPIKPPVPLSHWDTETLRHLLPWLFTNNVLLLLQTGNRLFNTKLHSQIMSLRYGRQNLVPSKEEKSVCKVFNWPCLLSIVPSPLIRLVSFRLDNMSFADVHCDLSALPPTLTKLVLIEASLLVSTMDQLRFRLPNLQHLRFDGVFTSLVTKDGHTPLADTWLSTALCESPELRVLRYIASMRSSSLGLYDVVRACLDVMPMLEKLTVPYYNYRINQWPAHLHTLNFHRFYYGGVALTNEPSLLTIPSSVNTLLLHYTLPIALTHRILRSAPTSLTCLEANLFQGRGDVAMEEIGRFTQLQSLHVPRNVDLMEINGYAQCNLAFLPPSVTALSDSFASEPSSWQHITRKVKLMNRKPDDFAKPLHMQAICTYEHCEDEEYLPHFPNGLRSIYLIDSNVPVANTSLQSVEMEINRVDVFSRFECATVFTNMPRTLTSLTITMFCAASLIWLDGFDEVTELASTRFPCLKRLSLELRVGLSLDQDICAWFRHLPQSLQYLKLSVNMAATFRPAPLDIANVVFPSSLTELRLRLLGCSIDMPLTLPTGLIKFELLWFTVNDVKSYDRIASWPVSLRKVNICAWGSNMKEELALSLKALGERLGRVLDTTSWLRE